MDKFRGEDIRMWQELAAAASRVALVSHTHPDGDALGCSTALAVWFREKCGKEVACLLPDTPSETLHFMLEPSVRYLFHDREPQEALDWIRSAELIVLQDCNAFSRTEGLAHALETAAVPKVLIDHHLNPDRASFNLVFSTPDISSASELLFWLLTELSGGAENLPPAAARALLTGMTTDTNNFANSVFPSTFRMASALVAAGVDRDAVVQQIYMNYRENRVRAMGYMQAEGLRMVPGGGAYMVLTREIQERFGIREGETEGLVNVPLSIGTVRLSVLLKEEEGLFRVSVRSKRGTSAQQLARSFFHGGGHENASGGKVLIGEDIPSAAEAPAYVESILKHYLS
jgi:phosphoesterase RecJ-like protein